MRATTRGGTLKRGREREARLASMRASAAAVLGLEPGLEAAHAAARLSFLQSQDDTEHSESAEPHGSAFAPMILHGVLNDEDITRCFATAKSSGRQSEPATAWRRPPPVCAALADSNYDIVYCAGIAPPEPCPQLQTPHATCAWHTETPLSHTLSSTRHAHATCHMLLAGSWLALG
jgi:hypothetical protein